MIKRISAVIEKNNEFSFSIMDPNTFRVEDTALGLYIDGPCEIVNDYDDKNNTWNPWRDGNIIGKRVWGLAKKEDIKLIDQITYYSDRLRTVININQRNIWYNARRVKVGEQEKGVCAVLKDNELTYCSGVKILGPSRWVYNPDRRIEHGDLSCAVWTETDSEVELLYDFTK